MNIRKSARGLLSVIVIMLLAVSVVVPSARVSAAACQMPAVDYGSATAALSVPSSGTYRLWTRIMVPDGVSNTYLLEIDGATCYNVGGGNISPNTWVWVDYRDGIATSKAQQALSAGSHTVKFIGNQPNVKIDRLIAVTDLTCVPLGVGDNCNAPDPPADVTPPSVTLTAPSAGATLSGNVSITATAADNTSVAKVEFYTDTTLVGSDTTAPYSVTVASTDLSNGSHLITARAYDAAGNVATDSRSITISNGDTAAPTTPTNLKASAMAYNKISLTWAASTDNTGVTGYTIIRNGVTIASVGAITNYEDGTVAPNTTYSYQVSARDAAGNKSSASTAASVKTPDVPDVEAPSAPINVVATPLSATQINLTWSASEDNIGVVSYDVYRGTTKVATVTSPSFGDSGLKAKTEYTYTVRARDAAGNMSVTSDAVSATTKQRQRNGMVRGVVRSRSGAPLSGVTVVAISDGSTSRIVTKTGSDGRYRLVFPSDFSGRIKYSKDGFRTERVSLTVPAGEIVTQRVKLSRR